MASTDSHHVANAAVIDPSRMLFDVCCGYICEWVLVLFYAIACACACVSHGDALTVRYAEVYIV